jgi:hypothetical protein
VSLDFSVSESLTGVDNVSESLTVVDKEEKIKYKGHYHVSWSSCSFAKNVQTLSSLSKALEQLLSNLQQRHSTFAESKQQVPTSLSSFSNRSISFAYFSNPLIILKKHVSVYQKQQKNFLNIVFFINYSINVCNKKLYHTNSETSTFPTILKPITFLPYDDDDADRCYTT